MTYSPKTNTPKNPNRIDYAYVLTVNGRLQASGSSLKKAIGLYLTENQISPERLLQKSLKKEFKSSGLVNLENYFAEGDAPTELTSTIERTILL